MKQLILVSVLVLAGCSDLVEDTRDTIPKPAASMVEVPIIIVEASDQSFLNTAKLDTLQETVDSVIIDECVAELNYYMSLEMQDAYTTFKINKLRERC